MLFFPTFSHDKRNRVDRAIDNTKSLKCISQRPTVSRVLPHNPSVPQMKVTANTGNTETAQGRWGGSSCRSTLSPFPRTVAGTLGRAGGGNGSKPLPDPISIAEHRPPPRPHHAPQKPQGTNHHTGLELLKVFFKY